jgi:hypothetical protein
MLRLLPNDVAFSRSIRSRGIAHKLRVSEHDAAIHLDKRAAEGKAMKTPRVSSEGTHSGERRPAVLNLPLFRVRPRLMLLMVTISGLIIVILVALKTLLSHNSQAIPFTNVTRDINEILPNPESVIQMTARVDNSPIGYPKIPNVSLSRDAINEVINNLKPARESDWHKVSEEEIIGNIVIKTKEKEVRILFVQTGKNPPTFTIDGKTFYYHDWPENVDGGLRIERIIRDDYLKQKKHRDGKQ